MSTIFVRKYSLFLSVLILFSLGCETSPKVTDITEPDISVSINTQFIYSTTQAISVVATTCSNSNTPAVPGLPNWPPSTVNGVIVVLDEDLPGPVYPFDYSVIASDPSGIRSITVYIPKGNVITSASQANVTSDLIRIYKQYSEPFLSTRALDFEYSPNLISDTVGTTVVVYDANGNEVKASFYIVPENEACN